MASQSEATFGNRLAHARTLQTAIAALVDYAPDNTDLTAANFKTFLDNTVEPANEGVAAKGQILSDARKVRRLAFYGRADHHVEGLATLAGRVRDYIGAMPGGKKSASYTRIQKLVQKISNYRSPSKPVSASPGATGPEKKKVSQSEASYGSLVQHGKDLVAAVAQVSGYNPTQADLKPVNLTLKMKALDDANKAVAEALIAAGNAIDARTTAYTDSETGLAARFQQIKAATATQYGRRSTTYGNIAAIKY